MSNIFKYDKEKSHNENIDLLKKKILEFKSLNKSTIGYRFFFDQSEQSLHKKVSNQFNISCSEMIRLQMIRHSLKSHNDIKIVVNLNNEILIILV